MTVLHFQPPHLWREKQNRGLFMDLVEEVSDFGAPEFVVNGPSSFEWISRSQVRITYYVRKKGQKVATHHAIWEISELIATHAMYEKILAILENERRRPENFASEMFAN